jgi:branched-chain amino acid transport system permease protein
VAIAAYFISIPILKLRGHYLAMGTLGLGIILYIVFNETVDITGGPNGFVGVPRLTLLGYEFASDYSYYYLMIGVLSIVLYIAINLINSRIGRALRALHTSEKAAQAVGVNIARYKVFVFTVSAVFAAVAGVLYAHYLQFIGPSSFGFIFSVELVAMVVLGGMASVWGAVIGAVFLTILPELLRDFHEIELALYGAILIATMMFMPRGIVGGASDLFKLVFKRKTSVEATEE